MLKMKDNNYKFFFRKTRY